jgi:hypothetical protein
LKIEDGKSKTILMLKEDSEKVKSEKRIVKNIKDCAVLVNNTAACRSENSKFKYCYCNYQGNSADIGVIGKSEFFNSK